MLRRDYEIVADLSGLKDRPDLFDIQAASGVAIEGYTDRSLDRVDIIYTEFVSAASQKPRRRQLLPVVTPEGHEQRATDFLFEPTPPAVLEPTPASLH